MQVAPLDSVASHAPAPADWSLWVLAACALVAAAIVAWKLVDLSVKAGRASRLLGRIDGLVERRMLAEALGEARAAGSPVGRALSAGLARRSAGAPQIARSLENATTIELADLERGLIPLAAIASAAPLIGFLGSVLALMSVLERPPIAPGTLASALLPAAVGLVVALAVTLLHHYLAARIERVSREVRRSALLIVDAVAAIDAGADDAASGAG